MNAIKSFAPAKVNLTLRVLGKRADGYHEIESLVAFADVGDTLTLTPGSRTAISVTGPFASVAGPEESNLVMKAARALTERIENLRSGQFTLVKNLPAGAGLGGGSADAAAALRMLADLNQLPEKDSRLVDAARATGADVKVCLGCKARLMRGIGDVLSAPLNLPAMPALLVFPAAPVATAPVYGGLQPNETTNTKVLTVVKDIPRDLTAMFGFLRNQPNDLEVSARGIAPVISEASDLLSGTGARITRMSGSGSTVFALYETREEVEAAATSVKSKKQDWWVAATTLR